MVLATFGLALFTRADPHPAALTLTSQARNSSSPAYVSTPNSPLADPKAPTPFLDGKHTIFGRISSGMKTVQRLEAVRTDSNDRPVEEIKIHKARLGEGGPLGIEA